MITRAGQRPGRLHEAGTEQLGAGTEQPDHVRARVVGDVAPEAVEGSLKHGILWTLGSQVPIQLIRVLGVVILARLLTPDDYGKASLAVALASFSMVLGDLGYGTALVQASAATQRWASTAWWSALVAGTIIFAVVALAAYPAALLLGESDVAFLVIAAGSTFLLVAFGSTSNALLTRAMNFRSIQSAAVLASAVATVTAVAAAAGGAGPWSLVAQQIVLAGISAATFVVLARWTPSFEYSRAAFRSLSRFALPFTGGSVLFSLQTILTTLLVGALIGIPELGIWTFSVALVVIPTVLISAPLSRVIYASFARMRDQKERVAELWLNGTAIVSAVILPALFGLVAVAPDLIPFVFGSQWIPAVPIVRILSLLAMLRSLQTWNTSVMDAAGKPHVSMWLNAAVLAVLPVAMWVGSTHGLEGVALCYVVAILLSGEIPSLLITTRELSVSVRSFLERLTGVVASCLLMLCSVVALRIVLDDVGVGIGLRLVVSIVFGAIVYVGCLLLFGRSIALRFLRVVRRRDAEG